MDALTSGRGPKVRGGDVETTILPKESDSAWETSAEAICPVIVLARDVADNRNQSESEGPSREVHDEQGQGPGVAPQRVDSSHRRGIVRELLQDNPAMGDISE